MSADPLQVAHPLAEVISARKQAIWFRIGAIWEQMNEPARALTAYETVLRHNSSHVEAMIRVGEMHQRELVPASITYLSTAVQLQPANGSAWASLAYSYVMGGDFDKAYHAYYQAFAHLRDRGNPMLWHGIGLLHDRLGHAEDALAAFNAALGLKPPFEKADEVYYAIGIIYKERGDYNTAHAYLSKVISLNSSPSALAEAYYQIGLIHDLAGNVAGAIEAYEIALRQQNHLRTMQSFAWLKHKTGKSAEAVELLRRAAQMEDTDGTTAYLLGRIYMANNEYRVAYDSYQQAVHLDGNNANYWCSIAALYYQRQQHRDAMDAFRRVININSDIPEIWFDLGALYEMYNQYNDAVNAYRIAVGLQPQNTRFTERLSILQRAVPSGSAPQPPMGKPASEDIHPMPFTIRRSCYKSDAPTRYGRLPPPPDVTLYRQNAAKQQQPTENAHIAGAVPNSGQAQANTGLSSSLPMEIMLRSSSRQHAANNGVVQSNDVGPTPESRPKENGGSQPQNNVNGRLGQRDDYGGNVSAGLTAGADHPTDARIGPAYPSPPVRVGIRENSHGPVSPGVAGAQTQPQEKNAQANGSQNLQSHDVSGQYKPGNDIRDERAWHGMGGRIPSDPTVKQSPYVALPRAEGKDDVPGDKDVTGKSGPSQSALHPALPVSSYQAELGVNNRQSRPPQVSSAPSAIARSPTTRSQMSSGRESIQQPGQYAEMEQSRGVEASSAPAGKRVDTSGDIASNTGPKQSASDEPSRRSVSSSYERTDRERSGTVEVNRDGRNVWGTGSGSKDVGVRIEQDVNASENRNFTRPESREVPGTSRIGPLVGTTGRDLTVIKDPFHKVGAQVDEEMLPKLPPLPATHHEQNPRMGEATHSSSVQQGTKRPPFSENDKTHGGNGPRNTQGLQTSHGQVYSLPSAGQNGNVSKSEPLLGQSGSPNFRDQHQVQTTGESITNPNAEAPSSPNRQKEHQAPNTLSKSSGIMNATAIGIGTHGKGVDASDRQGQAPSQKRSPVRPRSPISRPDSRFDRPLRGFGSNDGIASRHSSSPIDRDGVGNTSRPLGLTGTNDALGRVSTGNGPNLHGSSSLEQHRDVAGLSGENRRDTGSEYNGPKESSLKNPFGSRIGPPLPRPIPRSVPAPHASISQSQGLAQGETGTPTMNSENVASNNVIGGERSQVRRATDGDQSGLGKRSASFYENGNVKTRDSNDYGRGEPKSAVISPSIQKQEAGRDGPQQISYSEGMQYRPGRDGRSYGDDPRDLKRGRVHHAVGEAYVANRFSNGNV